MKILVFTDIHGCFNSLSALVNCEDFKSADEIVFLGDVAIGCSRPNECIDLINSLNCHCIIGNNDSYVINGIPKADLIEFSQQKIKQLIWMNENITENNKSILKGWEKSFELTINNKKFYFTHYPWEICDSEESVIDSPQEKTLESRKNMFKYIEADYFIFGHEHKTNYFSENGKHYFYLGTTGLKSPGCYLLISITNNNVLLEEKFIDFDINEEIELMDKAGYPYNKNKIKK